MERLWRTTPFYIGGLDGVEYHVRAFLASHPRIAIPAVESICGHISMDSMVILAKKDNFERCLNAMLNYKHVAFLQPDPERIRAEFWQGPPTYARLFELFLLHFAQREGKPRWGAQTG